MPDPTTFEQIKGMSLSASELKAMVPSWPDALIEDYLNIIRGIIKIAELLDIEIDQKIETIPTDFTDGSIPYADTNLLVEDNTNLKWNAIQKVLTAFNVYTNQIDFNLAPTITPAEGRLSWNPTDGTLDLGLGAGGIVTQQIGQELYVKAVNKTGATIPEGSAVYCAGRQGVRPKIALAKSDAESTATILGITTENILDNEEGFVTTFGYVRQIKTDYATWAEGDRLWVSKTTAGELTNVEPPAPHFANIAGSVGIIHATQGSILVCIQRHTTLEGLSDVNGTPLTATGQFPAWNNTSGYFDFNINMLLYCLSGSAYIKVDTTSPSDLHLITGAAKTVVYDTSVYDDLNFDPVRSGGPVATRPDEITINNVFYSEFTSANSQLCGSSAEIPHKYKLGTNINPHAHIFLKSGESVGTTGVTFTVYWELRVQTGTTSGSVTLSATSAQLGTTAGANNLHIYGTAFAGPSALEGQLSLTLARTGGDAGDIIVTTYGIHYEIDTPGSRTVSAK